MNYALVLRSGGDYGPRDVRKLVADIRRWDYDARIILFSDMDVDDCEIDVRQQLLTGWPGWWAKMELFAPWIRGNFLYMDLDSMVVSQLVPLIAECQSPRPWILRDFNRPDGLQSSLMWLPQGAYKRRIWQTFNKTPAKWMELYEMGGDQAFLESFAARFDVLRKGLVASFKVDCWTQGFIPSGACVVAFHGRPRPAEIRYKLPPRQETL